MRISLGKVMVTLAFFAAGLAALTRPNVAWGIVIPVLFLTMLLTAVLGTIFQQGQGRAFWAGFALFGCAYLVSVLFCEDCSWTSSIHGGQIISEPLSTLVIFLVRLGRKDRGALAEILRDLGEVSNTGDRIVIAISVLGLALASMGGVIGRWLAAPRPQSL
jgi:Na+-translocating ferredoxin:NAD+ oxidoreductase RnfD subunit